MGDVEGCDGVDCNCIVTRGGVYNEILPEPREIPRAEPEGFSECDGDVLVHSSGAACERDSNKYKKNS